MGTATATIVDALKAALKVLSMQPARMTQRYMEALN